VSALKQADSPASVRQQISDPARERGTVGVGEVGLDPGGLVVGQHRWERTAALGPVRSPGTAAGSFFRV
jgi:hypothetical protein